MGTGSATSVPGQGQRAGRPTNLLCVMGGPPEHQQHHLVSWQGDRELANHLACPQMGGPPERQKLGELGGGTLRLARQGWARGVSQGTHLAEGIWFGREHVWSPCWHMQRICISWLFLPLAEPKSLCDGCPAAPASRRFHSIALLHVWAQLAPAFLCRFLSKTVCPWLFGPLSSLLRQSTEAGESCLGVVSTLEMMKCQHAL